MGTFDYKANFQGWKYYVFTAVIGVAITCAGLLLVRKKPYVPIVVDVGSIHVGDLSEEALAHMVKIEGSLEFQTNVVKVYNFIKKYAPDDYQFITNSIRIIRAGKSTFYSTTNVPPVCYVNEDEFLTNSLPWNACIIAHEAMHGDQFKRAQKSWRPDRRRIYYSVAAEKESIKYSVTVLKKVGGTISQVKVMESEDGTHILRKRSK